MSAVVTGYASLDYTVTLDRAPEPDRDPCYCALMQRVLSDLIHLLAELVDNATTVITSVVKAKPTVAKGKYVKGCYLSSSMGPGISIDTSAVEAAAKA